MRFAAALLLASLSIAQARAACVDQLSQLDEQVKKHPKQGDMVEVQKNLRSAHALVEVDELACLNAVTRARRAFAAPTPKTEPNNHSSNAVQPLNQPAPANKAR